jgi:hypothetical protein
MDGPGAGPNDLYRQQLADLEYHAKWHKRMDIIFSILFYVGCGFFALFILTLLSGYDTIQTCVQMTLPANKSNTSLFNALGIIRRLPDNPVFRYAREVLDILIEFPLNLIACQMKIAECICCPNSSVISDFLLQHPVKNNITLVAYEAICPMLKPMGLQLWLDHFDNSRKFLETYEWLFAFLQSQ